VSLDVRLSTVGTHHRALPAMLVQLVFHHVPRQQVTAAMAVETMGWVYAMHRSTAIPVFVSSENSLQIDIPLQNTSLAKHRTKETKCTMNIGS